MSKHGCFWCSNGNTLIEDAEETKAIELIREQKAKEFSLRAICSELSVKGYKPRGNKWHPMTVKRILMEVA
ncbi:MAG: recombinase family protein [Nitrospirae bacterium]|nr:recombinase family protein [Nitrospirota bacterium]